MTTLKDISKATGVSISTVSAVLKNREHCYASEITKAKIKATAKKLNYFPNIISQALKGMPTNTIGILGHVFSVPIRSELISELSNGLWDAGYQVLIGDSMLRFEREEELIKQYIQRCVDAIIIVDGTELEQIEKIIPENIPFIISKTFNKGKYRNFLNTDKEKGGYLATEHLVGHEHKKIGFYTLQLSSNKEKYEGYLNALANNGLESFIIEAKDYPKCEDENQALNDALFFIKSKKVTSFVCTNDSLAANLIRTLQKNNIRVPEDVAIIGYDGLNFSALTNPAITTVKQPIQKLANEILKNIFNSIKNKKTNLERRLIEPTLILRESCGCKKYLQNQNNERE